jgi:ribosomal protein L12E/L44/L45/RPP1/RPP2
LRLQKMAGDYVGVDALLLRVHAQVQHLKKKNGEGLKNNGRRAAAAGPCSGAATKKKNGEGLLPRRAGAVSMGTHGA